MGRPIHDQQGEVDKQGASEACQNTPARPTAFRVAPNSERRDLYAEARFSNAGRLDLCASFGLQVAVVVYYLVQFIQLLLFIMAPTWEWNLNYKNTFWRWFQRFQARLGRSTCC